MRDPDRTLHMIGNAHLDPVWLWQWPEGLQAAKATFRSALDRLHESADFVFTSSAAAVYEWVEQNDPDLFAEIRERVAEGRWQIVGGWWVQPDCNLPSGESFVRQALYGQRYFREKLGVTASVGYNPDSFGHHAMLPQLLAKSGFDSYVFMRPEPHEKDLPGRLFWWEADDGSRVLAYHIPFAYTAGLTIAGLETHLRRCADELATAPYPELMCFYGVGNHGGGPTRDNLRRIAELDRDPDWPRLRHGSPRAFFDRVPASDLELPVVHDELQFHAKGCYAAHSGIKRWNRQAENLLLAAEKWSAVAQRVVDHPYPAVELTRAWKQVLFNQNHDILPGTSIEPAYDDARDTYGEAIAIARRGLHQALQAISWRIAIGAEEGMTPIVVFNPQSWPTRVAVELDFGRLGDDDVLLDDRDRRVPVQVVRSLAAVVGWRNRLCFVADLPALGYRVYRVASRPAHPAAPAVPLAADGETLENDRLRLRIEPATGEIADLYDKRHGVEILRPGAAKPVVIADPSDTWSHGVRRFDEILGAFTATRVRLVESGPVRAVLRVKSAYGASTMAQDFVLYAELDAIEVRVTVDWRERFKLLKLLFPLNLVQTEVTYEIPYGVIRRPANGEEEPGLAWIDLTGRAPDTELPYGLSILNDGKYSFHAAAGEIGLTVLRSPLYAHHDPFVPDPDAGYAVMDQGVQRFTYVLLPHAGDWRAAGAVRRAAELNQPAVAMAESYHDGPLPHSASYLAVAADNDNVVLGALKRAEDDDDLVVRCAETAGHAASATLRLAAWDRDVEAVFSPFEIKTMRVPRDGTRPVTETDLIEWPLTPAANAD